MAQRRKTPRAKPSESSSDAANGATPGAWERKGVAINLSQARRLALKAFAAGDEELMSPAQALYALIDKLCAEEPSSTALARPQADPAGRDPVSLVASLEAKLSAVERLSLDNSAALGQCADSLEQIAVAMEPMRELISALLAERRPSRAAALDPSEWIRRAVSALGCSPRSELALRLAVRERALDGAETLALIFEATPIAIDKAPIKAPVRSLPLLRVSGIPGGSELAAALDKGQPGALALFCAPADRGRWRGQIRRQGSGGSFSPALLEMIL
jgi:hypothetical protein